MPPQGVAYLLRIREHPISYPKSLYFRVFFRTIAVEIRHNGTDKVSDGINVFEAVCFEPRGLKHSIDERCTRHLLTRFVAMFRLGK